MTKSRCIMAIERVCRRCGTAFVPSREDLLLGPLWYRLCPRCRPNDDPAPGDRHAPNGGQ